MSDKIGKYPQHQQIMQKHFFYGIYDNTGNGKNAYMYILSLKSYPTDMTEVEVFFRTINKKW
jgi:hypothetical protein